MRRRAYYAHCLSIYNTTQEDRDLATIDDLGYDTVNPNSPECSEGYKKEGMEFFKRFSESCDVIFFRDTPDGAIPAGVGKEIDYFVAAGKPVIELPSGIQRRLLTVDQTREYLNEIGYR